MNTINREDLKRRLIDDEGYVEAYGIEKTIDNLLNLQNLDDKSAYDMLVQWMETGKISKFNPIEGIDLKYLRDTLKMKDPAIILAYGMLLFDPKGNAVFFRQQEKSRNALHVKNSGEYWKREH